MNNVLSYKIHKDLHAVVECSYAHRLRNSEMPFWDKIARIESYVATQALPNREYDYPTYHRLLKGFLRRGENIPLSAYAVCRAGVCREYALLTHFLLKEAGIPNWHVYAQIHRASNTDRYDIIEDHAFTVLKNNGEYWVADPYYFGFNGFRLKDLLRPEGITKRRAVAPIGEKHVGFRSILQINPFPKIWFPKDGPGANQLELRLSFSKFESCRFLFQKLSRYRYQDYVGYNGFLTG